MFYLRTVTIRAPGNIDDQPELALPANADAADQEAFRSVPEDVQRVFNHTHSALTVRELRDSDSSFKLYTVFFKVTADGKGKVQTMNVSRIVDPRSPETKLPEVQLPQAYLDVARAKSEASLQNPTRRGGIESVSSFSFTPERPTIVIADLNLPLDKQS